MSDEQLVERLRSLAEGIHPGWLECRQAADAIERLEAELAEERGERKNEQETWHSLVTSLRSELAEAKGDALSFEWAADRVRGAERELAETRAEIERKDKALTNAQKFIEELSGQISTSGYEVEELGKPADKAWEPLYNWMFNGKLASYRDEIGEALAAPAPEPLKTPAQEIATKPCPRVGCFLTDSADCAVPHDCAMRAAQQQVMPRPQAIICRRQNKCTWPNCICLVSPHDYAPSTTHQGECAICGQIATAKVHLAAQQQAPERKET